MIFIKPNHRKWIYVLGSLIFFLWFAYQVPFGHDDWKWGTPARWEMLSTWFAGYNGRYLGNLSILLITRSTVFKVLNMGLASFLVVFLGYLIFAKSRLSSHKTSLNAVFLLCGVLLFAAPNEIFQQTYGFPAGFANFVNPLVFILLYYLMVQKIFLNEEIRFPWWQSLLMLPLGFVSTLFSEHNSIFCIMMAVVVIGYVLITRRKVYLATILYLISSCIGSLLMFINPAYTDTGYKSIDISIKGFIIKYIEEMSDSLFFKNFILNICFAVICLILLAKAKPDEHKKSIFYSKGVKIFLQTILISFSLYQILYQFYPSWNILNNEVYTARFNAVFAGVFMVCVLLCIVLFVSPMGRKMRMLAFSLGGIASAAPLLAAEPIGPRCFLTSYTLLAMCVIDLILYVKDLYYERVHLEKLMLPVFAAVYVFYFTIFWQIGTFGRAQQARLQEETQNGATEVSVYSYPNSQYIWVTSPEAQEWKDAYVIFYQLPSGTVIHWR